MLLLNLCRAETRRSPFPTHPYRCIRQASEDSKHCGEDIGFLQMLFAPNAQLTTLSGNQIRRRANLKLALRARKDSGQFTGSIARQLMRRREEIVRATERIRDIRLPVPLQYALDETLHNREHWHFRRQRIHREHRDRLSAHLK